MVPCANRNIALPQKRYYAADLQSEREEMVKLVGGILHDYLFTELSTIEALAGKQPGWFASAVRTMPLHLMSSLLRSQDSKIGAAMEDIHLRLADLYGADNGWVVPTRLWHPDISLEMAAQARPARKMSSGHSRPYVLTNLDRQQLERSASKVVSRFKGLKPRNRTRKRLLRYIAEEHVRLARYARGTVTTFELDGTVAVVDETGAISELMLMELKLKGELDSTKLPGELTNLVKAVLALGPQEFPVLPVGVCVEDVSTHTLSQLFPDDLLLVGRQLWEPVLPAGMTFEDFHHVYSEAAQPYGLDATFARLGLTDGHCLPHLNDEVLQLLRQKAALTADIAELMAERDRLQREHRQMLRKHAKQVRASQKRAAYVEAKSRAHIRKVETEAHERVREVKASLSREMTQLNAERAAVAAETAVVKALREDNRKALQKALADGDGLQFVAAMVDAMQAASGAQVLAPITAEPRQKLAVKGCRKSAVPVSG